MLRSVREWSGNVAEVVSRYRKQNPNQQTQIKMKTKTLFLGAAIAASTASPLAAVTLLNDTFSDNERATQSLTGSAEWGFAPNGGTNTNANLSAATGALVYTPQAAATAQHSTAYFTASGSPAALAVGESITLTFDFTLTALGASTENGLRFGLFNSNGSRYGAGFSSTAQSFSNLTVFDDSTGFFTTANVGATTGQSLFGARKGNASGSNTTPFGGSSTITGAFTNSGYLGLVASTAYTASLSITRNTATQAFVSTTINGFTQSGTTTGETASTLSFDSFTVLTGSAIVPTGNTFTIDNVNVTVVPEPSVAMLGALGALALLRRRR